MMHPINDGEIQLNLNLIRDAYARIVTNRDPVYRKEQEEKIKEWTEKATIRYEQILNGTAHL